MVTRRRAAETAPPAEEPEGEGAPGGDGGGDGGGVDERIARIEQTLEDLAAKLAALGGDPPAGESGDGGPPPAGGSGTKAAMEADIRAQMKAAMAELRAEEQHSQDHQALNAKPPVQPETPPVKPRWSTKLMWGGEK